MTKCIHCGHRPFEHTEDGCAGGRRCKCKTIPRSQYHTRDPLPPKPFDQSDERDPA